MRHPVSILVDTCPMAQHREYVFFFKISDSVYLCMHALDVRTVLRLRRHYQIKSDALLSQELKATCAKPVAQRRREARPTSSAFKLRAMK